MTEETKPPEQLDPMTAQAGEIEALKAKIAALEKNAESANANYAAVIQSNKMLLGQLQNKSGQAPQPPAPSDDEKALASFEKAIGFKVE